MYFILIIKYSGQFSNDDDVFGGFYNFLIHSLFLAFIYLNLHFILPCNNLMMTHTHTHLL
jgi:hypothetical protein